MAFRVVRQRREARRQAKLDEIFLVSNTAILTYIVLLQEIGDVPIVPTMNS